MSSDRNHEVVSCDASIMKNVWEMRTREYTEKIKVEEERKAKSALPSINKEWANRLAFREGKIKYQKVERKSKPAEIQLENIWKDKDPRIPPILPRAAGSHHSGRLNKERKGQFKKFDRLQLLQSITQIQPSPLVWGKSWKFAKSLPSPAEGTTVQLSKSPASIWGQCWMFAPHQPCSEAGKPWPNGPNSNDPRALYLWRKPEHRMAESQDLVLCAPTEEWMFSWKRSDKENDKDHTSPEDGKNIRKPGFDFDLFLDTQRRNQTLRSTEWMDSWKCTMQASQGNLCAFPKGDIIDKSVANKQSVTEIKPEWRECWKFINHHGGSKSISQDNSHRQEWYSYRPHRVPYEKRYRDVLLQFCETDDWNVSWQVAKNNSKPSEEIEKVLKLSQQKNKLNKEQQSTQDNYNIYNEQLKKSVIYNPKIEFIHSRHLRNMENILPVSEWKESQKTTKHRIRMERRKMRLEPQAYKVFRGSNGERLMASGTSEKGNKEWKDSWKLTCHRQETHPWQHVWLAIPQRRVDRLTDQNHFAPVELPKNGPTGEQSWGESWRFPRHQQRSEPRQRATEINQNRLNAASHYLAHQAVPSLCDWQEAWMVSETPFHHDRPSSTEWTGSWKSVFHTHGWTESAAQEKCTDELQELQVLRRKMRTQRAIAKINMLFDNSTFMQSYALKEWNDAWRAGSNLNHQMDHSGLSKVPVKTMESAVANDNNDGPKWGKSFRLANPMPHLELPWIRSSPNRCHHAVIWSSGNSKIRCSIAPKGVNNHATRRFWANSHQFLQGPSIGMMSKEPVDPRVILIIKPKTWYGLFSVVNEDHADRKMLGNHLLAKTQPRVKKNTASVTKIKTDGVIGAELSQEWEESWKFRLSGLEKQMPVKSLSSWRESWRFLLPDFPPLKGTKA